jgi:hypothetical protein
MGPRVACALQRTYDVRHRWVLGRGAANTTFDRCASYAPGPEWDRGMFRRPGARALRRIVLEDRTMDSERFDTITRTLASGMSRRGVLRTLGGVSAGGVLAMGGRGTITAKGRQCKDGGTPCGKRKRFACCTSDQQCRSNSSGSRCVPAAGGCYSGAYSDGTDVFTTCDCWTSGTPGTGGSSCGANTCATETDGTCAAQGASCSCS